VIVTNDDLDDGDDGEIVFGDDQGEDS
jgi:hypothetical protein